MKKRDVPKEVPDRRPFFVVEIEDLDPHHMRIPSPARSSQLLKALRDAHLEEGLELNLETAEESLEDITALQGAVIGTSWAHRELELETRRREFENLLDYGTAVYEELWDEGYTMTQTSQLWARCVERLVGDFISEKEVLDRMGFTKGRAPTPTPPSTSESATAETPGSGNA
ncbi:MAG: hypothetical protein GY719_13320 [bacterium]|nr:hypothetical protein [bacterium]